ncbi:MAG TPA: chlororespiratory reduction protein 7 [Candidatus Caenarcaniphilales bacterium]
MPDSLMYEQEMFVLLQPDQPEQFLTAAELLEKLQLILAQRQDNLPPDLQQLASIEAQAQRLLDTACELDVGPGQFFQWYVTRLEK